MEKRSRKISDQNHCQRLYIRFQWFHKGARQELPRNKGWTWKHCQNLLPLSVTTQSLHKHRYARPRWDYARVFSTLWVLRSETRNTELHKGPRKSCKIEFRRSTKKKKCSLSSLLWVHMLTSLWNLFMIDCNITYIMIFGTTHKDTAKPSPLWSQWQNLHGLKEG